MEIDFKRFEEYLDARKNRKVFITKDNIIKQSDVEKIRELIRKYGKVNTTYCIRMGGALSDSGNRFTVEMVCNKCKNVSIEYLKLCDFIEYLVNDNYKCNDCMRAKRLEARKEQQTKMEERIITTAKKTDDYISSYLDPNSSWNNGVKTKEKISSIEYGYLDAERIRNHILQMDYRTFLATPYWKAITEYKRYKAEYKCELCSSSISLVVHHKTYEHHGNEINHLDDLVVLCKSCHEKFHDIKQEVKE